jgi:hypothetical protein
MDKYLLLVIMGVFLQPLWAEERLEFCDEYAKNIVKQQLIYNNYCNTTEENETVFPAFSELMQLRETQQQEPSESDHQNPEHNWCLLVDPLRIMQQQEQLTTVINDCKTHFQSLFGRTAKNIAALVPEGYRLAKDKDIAPLLHDFNHDGVNDAVFVIINHANAEKARILLALSQKDGLLKTVPIAPYIVGMDEAESGRPHTRLQLIKPDRFSIATQSMNNNNWDSKEEWVFRFINNQFVLIWSATGSTRISYDEGQESVYASSIHNYMTSKTFKSSSERCDFYQIGKEKKACHSVKTVVLENKTLTLENFLDAIPEK